MILNWIHNRENKELKCVINDNLHYITLDGGGTITRYLDGNEYVITDWEDQKHWLSANYPELGVYEPFDLPDDQQEQWMIDNNWEEAFPSFGVCPNGHYLDRLQRLAEVQELKGYYDYIYEPENKLNIIMKKGEYFKREWCEENNSFYNLQPCCVFPDNPGLTPLTKEQAESYKSRG